MSWEWEVFGVSVSYPFDTPAGSDVDAEGVRSLAEAPVACAGMSRQPVRLVLGYPEVRQVLEWLEPRIREIAGGPLDEVAAWGKPAGLVPLPAKGLPTRSVRALPLTW